MEADLGDGHLEGHIGLCLQQGDQGVEKQGRIQPGRYSDANNNEGAALPP